jgi:EmrB/QacA subfamily drug resistance transporter
MLGLAAGPVLTMVDSSVVNVALAAITGAFGSSLATTQWIASGYLLAMAVALPATAYLAKRLGSMTTYLGCMLGFTLVSALCALAPNAEVLIGLRVLQGAFGAPLTPLAIAMFLGGDNTDTVVRSPVIAGIVFFAAPALGPTLGGLLIDSVGWPWIFWINVPIGVIGIVSVLRVGLHEPRDHGARFDGIGFVLLGLGAGLAVYGANEGPQVGWLAAGSLPFWASGGVIVGAYFTWAARRQQPLLDVRLLLHRRIAVLSTSVTAVASVVMFAMLILVPTYLQLVQGISPVAAGLVLLPQALATGLGLGLGARVAARAGIRLTAVAGMLALVVGTVVLLLIGGDTPPGVIAGLLCMRGFAVGFVEQPLLSAMLAGLSRVETAHFSTLYDVTQRMAGSVGVGVFLTLFQVRERVDIASALGRVRVPLSDALLANVGGGSSASAASLPPAIHRAVASAMSQALGETSLALLTLALVGTVLALALPTMETAPSAKRTQPPS